LLINILQKQKQQKDNKTEVVLTLKQLYLRIISHGKSKINGKSKIKLYDFFKRGSV